MIAGVAAAEVLGGSTDPLCAISQVPRSAITYDIGTEGEHTREVADWGHWVQSVHHVGNATARNKQKSYKHYIIAPQSVKREKGSITKSPELDIFILSLSGHIVLALWKTAFIACLQCAPKSADIHVAVRMFCNYQAVMTCCSSLWHEWIQSCRTEDYIFHTFCSEL